MRFDPHRSGETILGYLPLCWYGRLGSLLEYPCRCWPNGRLDRADDGARKSEKRHVSDRRISKKSYNYSLADNPTVSSTFDWDCREDDRLSAEVDTAVDVQLLTSVWALDTADSHCRSMVDGTCSTGERISLTGERKDSNLLAFVLITAETSRRHCILIKQWIDYFFILCSDASVSTCLVSLMQRERERDLQIGNYQSTRRFLLFAEWKKKRRKQCSDENEVLRSGYLPVSTTTGG